MYQVSSAQTRARPREAQTIQRVGGGSTARVIATRIAIQTNPRKRKMTTIRRSVVSSSGLPLWLKRVVIAGEATPTGSPLSLRGTWFP